MGIDYRPLEGGIHEIVINRPERMNALDVPAKRELGRIWRDAAQDPSVSVLVLRGAGEKAFCAGSDIKEMQATGTMVDTRTLMDAIPGIGVELHKPVVAALHGFTIGMGLTLAIHADFRIAAETGKLGFPEVQHGMLSGVSAVTLPGLVGEPRALDLMLTARLIEPREALRIGLVDEVVPDSVAAAMALARRIASNSAAAVAQTKRLILLERRRRARDHAAAIDDARLAILESKEFGDVVAHKPGAGRIR
ncbi:MAG: hydratase [Bordetella sp. SCN 67-23]|nr:enoyl-CoA hydratase/isomerase family protein [Burkholderiales bacterium]ODS71017.1 MAG: hydratase [Bordetella sp. SCN 67-23]OJW94475.1 MAG: hydratase [Burkholderiales bacterium 67-32]